MKYIKSRLVNFNKAFIIYFLSIFLCALSCIQVKGQVHILLQQCVITGASSVNCGSSSTYLISGCSAKSWTTSCGVIQSSTSTSVSIYFNSPSCTSATITAVGSTAIPKVVTITAPTLTGGTISNTNQVIIYNTIPAAIIASPATGGNCAGIYTYQWQQSYDQVNWTNIIGATSQNLSFNSAVTQTTYYQRKVSILNSSSVGYSNIANVNILNAGSISPPSQNINYGASASMLLSTGVSGGANGYSYQWQSSPDNSTWTNIGGAVLYSYTPITLTASTYFRVIVTSNGVSANSSSSNVNVYPQVYWGSLSSLSQNINYNTAPAALSVSGASGGNGTYSYQWQSSPDNSVFTNISGAVSTSYSPGALTATTYYRVVVTSNGASINSASTNVNVYPQVNAGIVNPSTQTINYNTAPAALSVSGVTGGNGSYSYQWQSSPDNTTWNNINGATSASYASGNLTATTYYHVIISSNGVPANSSSTVVNIISPDLNYNFIRVRSILKAGVMDSATAAGLTSPFDVSQTTQYFDGLGREIQTVAMQQSPLQKDLVSINVYDAFGREPNKYLPYVASMGDGFYKTTAATDQNTFNTAQYPGEQYYYGQTNFEASPLNRVLNTYAPGVSWVGASRGVSAQYMVNTADENVRIWNIDFAQGSIPASTAAYAAGTLYKNITTDEAGHSVVEYKDMEGKVILKKVQVDANPGTDHTGWLCTYYIYDDLDNLRFVIQPQGVVAINSNWIITQPIADELCFRYEYDLRKRMIIKKIPGAGETWMVYDARDRLVMTQDANLRTQGKWMIMVYDDRNRPYATGLLTDMNNLSYHQNLAYNSINYPSANANFELLTSTYYDDYTWVANTGAPVGATITNSNTSNGNYFYTNYNSSPTYAVAITPHYITRGMATGSMTKVIGTANQYLYSVHFYDDRGRVIQSQSINYTGGVDITTIQYDFTGKTLRTLLQHNKNGNTPQSHTVLTKMDYDHGFRLQHIYKNIDGAPADQLIAAMQYNELGQLQTKSLGNNVDNLTYDYNIRGWLTGINKNYVAGTSSNYFGMELGYDKTTSVANGNTYVNPQFNGNIGGTVWKSAGDGVNRKYDFTYDNVNRLIAADFNQSSGSSFDKSAGIDFSVSNLSYDANGNILSMNQNGFTVGGSSPIDQLTYTYQTNSNKLLQVNDAANNPSSTLGDFHYTGTKSATDYTYDGNGNLNLDNNKNISSIAYNYLNLPQSVVFTAKGNISYVYDASGDKLQKITTDNPGNKITTTTYIGSFVYQATSPLQGTGVDTLQFIAHEEGRTRWAWHKYVDGTTAYGFEYDFFEKDHLGNTRMVLTQQRDITNYIATMENANRTTEDQLFANIDVTAYPVSSISGYPTDNTTNPNAYVAKVNGSNQKAGPSLLLKVMSGDAIDVAVKSFYINNGSNSAQNSSITDVITSLANGLAGASTAIHGNVVPITQTNGNVYNGLFNFLQNDDPNTLPTKPKAYLNWVLLDDQFNCVNTYPQSGAVPVGNAGILNTIGYAGIPITKNGYLYIWVSNETQNWDVFFDNLSVQHRSGPILEENHYYPFGLTMAGIGDKAVKTNYSENKRLFTGQLFDDDLGWNTYQMKFRTMDPQIGRFLQVDPLALKYVHNSTYAYAENEVIRAIDIEGLEKYIVTMRSFIPQKTVSNPNPFSNNKTFAGDNRNQYQANATSYRTEQKVSTDLDNKSASLLNNTASGSTGFDKNGKVNERSTSDAAGTVQVSFNENADGKLKDAEISFSTDASNKLVPGAPSINADITLDITPNKDGTFNFSVKGATDGFPAYELWVNDDKGNSYLLLGSNPNESSKTPWSLYPPEDQKYNYSGNSKDVKKPSVVNFSNTKNTTQSN